MTPCECAPCRGGKSSRCTGATDTEREIADIAEQVAKLSAVLARLARKLDKLQSK